MTFYFGTDLLQTGQALRFWITFAAEFTVIILVYFALKKRDSYKDQRKNDSLDLKD